MLHKKATHFAGPDDGNFELVYLQTDVSHALTLDKLDSSRGYAKQGQGWSVRGRGWGGDGQVGSEN